MSSPQGTFSPPTGTGLRSPDREPHPARPSGVGPGGGGAVRLPLLRARRLYHRADSRDRRRRDPGDLVMLQGVALCSLTRRPRTDHTVPRQPRRDTCVRRSRRVPSWVPKDGQPLGAGGQAALPAHLGRPPTVPRPGERGAAGYPVRAIRGQAAARHFSLGTPAPATLALPRRVSGLLGEREQSRLLIARATVATSPTSVCWSGVATAAGQPFRAGLVWAGVTGDPCSVPSAFTLLRFGKSAHG
jgi:hypothetical protein